MCDVAGTAERSYPVSKVRAAAKRSYLASEVTGGWEELLHVQGQGWMGGDTPRPRSGPVAERSYPASDVSGGWRRHPTSEVRAGGREELSCV